MHWQKEDCDSESGPKPGLRGILQLRTPAWRVQASAKADADDFEI